MAVSFDGSSQWINCGDLHAAESVNALSVCGWFKLATTQAAYFGVVSKGNDSGATSSWYLWGDGSTGKLYWQVSDSTSTFSVTNNTNYKDNAWHWFMAQLSATTHKGRLSIDNGAFVDTSALTGDTLLKDTTNPVMLGRYNANLRLMSGQLFDVRIYSGNVGTNAMQSIYSGRGSDNYVASLLARWPLLGAETVALSGSNTVIDISGNGYHGTATGSPTYTGAAYSPFLRGGR